MTDALTKAQSAIAAIEADPDDTMMAEDIVLANGLLALAEQQQIANLIAIGIAPTMDITVKDGRPVQELLTPEVRAAALRLALRGLGLGVPAGGRP